MNKSTLGLQHPPESKDDDCDEYEQEHQQHRDETSLRAVAARKYRRGKTL